MVLSLSAGNMARNFAWMVDDGVGARLPEIVNGGIAPGNADGLGASGLQLASYSGNAGTVYGARFSPAGDIAYTITNTGDLRSWRTIDRDALVEWVRANRQLDELSCAERERYLLPCPAGS